jgi:hypothetical protein
MMLSTKIEETYFSPPYCNVFMHRNCELLLMDFYSSELMQDCSRETEPFSLSLNIALAFFLLILSPFLPIKFQLQINRNESGEMVDGMFTNDSNNFHKCPFLPSIFRCCSSDIKLPINFRSVHNALYAVD